MRVILISAIFVVSGAFFVSPLQAGPVCTYGKPLPEFVTGKWFNSKPLKRADLKGKVVLIDVWTFACWNCYRSFPWLNKLEAGFKGKKFQVIGVHTPEFRREKVASNVKRHIRKYKLKHPVVMDNKMVYWRRLNNRYWPAYFLVDKKGCIRDKYAGETHIGDRQALAIERRIKELMAE